MTTAWHGYDPVSLGLEIRAWAGPDEAMCSCPFHGGSDSLCLNVRRGLFICFACGERGTVAKIAIKTGGHVEQVLIKADTRGDDDSWREYLKGELAIDDDYLASRHVTNDQVETFRIMRHPIGIVIPLTNWEGEIVGILMRRNHSRPGMTRYVNYGEKPPLWPLDLTRKMVAPGEQVALVEGVFGLLAANRANVPAFTSMGAAVKTAAAPILNRYKPIVMFDDDFAGYAGAGRVLRLAPHAKVVVPGVEADEMSTLAWHNVFSRAARGDKMIRTTRDLDELAMLSGDREKFFKYLPRIYRRQL